MTRIELRDPTRNTAHRKSPAVPLRARGWPRHPWGALSPQKPAEVVPWQNTWTVNTVVQMMRPSTQVDDSARGPMQIRHLPPLAPMGPSGSSPGLNPRKVALTVLGTLGLLAGTQACSTPAAKNDAGLRPQAQSQSQADRPEPSSTRRPTIPEATPATPTRAAAPEAPASERATMPEDYARLLVSLPEDAREHAKLVTRVRLETTEPWHLNDEYPISLDIAAPDGVAMHREHFGKSEAATMDADGIEFDVEYVAASSGEKRFEGQMKFAVCTDHSCLPRKMRVEFNVDVRSEACGTGLC